MVVVIGRVSWWIDVLVVQYINLTGGGGVDMVSSDDASPYSESYVD